jgi:hypothetical protein
LPVLFWQRPVPLVPDGPKLVLSAETTRSQPELFSPTLNYFSENAPSLFDRDAIFSPFPRPILKNG